MGSDPAVRLRLARPADAVQLGLWRSEDSIRRFQPLKDLSVADLRAELAGQKAADLDRGQGEKFQWIIEVAGEPAGWVTLVIQDWVHGLGEIGYSLGTEYQGRGLMLPVLRRFLQEIFRRTDLYRIEARCAVGNVASQKVLKNAGFELEGTLRSYFVLRGQRFDNHLFAFLRGDLPATER